MRNFNFQTGEYYHIYNRGVDKRNIFMDEKDYTRFIRSMSEFNNIDPIGSLYRKDYEDRKKKEAKGVQHPIGCWTPNQPKPNLLTPDKFNKHLVEFICYSLLPNHYHFLIKQLVSGGISEFMKRISGGYTNYFNRKNNRSGSLFEGNYKAILVKKYSHFLRLAVYINCNSEVHRIRKAENWPWSSYLDYVNKRNGSLCNKKMILNEFRNIKEFKNFCNQVLPGIIKIPELNKYLLE